MPTSSTFDPLVVYVAHEFPPRSETFVVTEANALREKGHDVLLYPISRTGQVDAGWVLTWKTALRWNILPLGVVSIASAFRHYREIVAQARLAPRTLRQRLKFVKAFLHATALSAVLRRRGRPVHLHAHFFGMMSEVALLARWMLPEGTTVSIMGHAGDVTRPASVERLRREAEASDFVACASTYVQELLQATGAMVDNCVVRCGVLPRKAAEPTPSASGLLRVVSVGRLVEKKGFDDCLRACALLARDGLRVLWTVVGDGPEAQSLEILRKELGVSELVGFAGWLPSGAVSATLAATCDVFVLPCKVARNGDSDGIPVALMEAMSFGLPVVSTAVGGIPELISDGWTGFLVQPSDPLSLAGCIQGLAADPARAREIGLRGRDYVRTRFSAQTEAATLWAKVLETRNRQD